MRVHFQTKRIDKINNVTQKIKGDSSRMHSHYDINFITSCVVQIGKDNATDE